ncbi:MAG: hypothetical protein Q9223_005992 [Gallowayella weberi]
MLGATWIISAEELTFGGASGQYMREQRQQISEVQAFEGRKIQEADKQSIPLAATSDLAREIRESKDAPQDLKNTLKAREGEEMGVAGMARRLWYGSETGNWKEKRMREEREALEEGRGYGGLIGDAVREVFGGSVAREDVEAYQKEREKKAKRAKEEG